MLGDIVADAMAVCMKFTIEVVRADESGPHDCCIA